MANRNGKGPENKGPMTGRQMGKCEGAEPTEDARRCGRPCGRGRGRGFRRNQDA